MEFLRDIFFPINSLVDLQDVFIDGELYRDEQAVRCEEGKRAPVEVEDGTLLDLFPEGMRDVLVLEVIVFRLEPALDEVVRVVHNEGEELCDERGQEEDQGWILILTYPLLEVGLEVLVTCEVYEAANHRAIEHGRKASREAVETLGLVDLPDHSE